MKRPYKRLCASILCLAISIIGPQALAQSQTTSGTRMGCVFHGPSMKQFIDAQRSRDQVSTDLQKTYGAANTIADPCLAGQVANMPAAVYQGLASKYPGQYAPLPPQASTTNAVAAAQAAQGPRNFPFSYSFTNLDNAAPSGLLSFFAPVGITDTHKVIGVVYDNDFNPSLASYQGGMVNVMIAGAIPNTVSHNGVVAGYVVTDPVNGYSQAAIFRGNSVELIPRAPDEVTSQVVFVTDQGTALVISTDASANNTAYLYRSRKLGRITFSFPGYVTLTGMNNALTVVGYGSSPPSVYTAFKYDANTNATTLLPPLATEPSSWAMGINESGDIVGYSFVPFGLERIGIWSGGRPFDTYFTEGTPQTPTISNLLFINDARLIVITKTNDGQSYLIPAKGTRVLLSDYVNYDAATYGTLLYVLGLNDFGELTGFTAFGTDFLLAP